MIAGDNGRQINFLHFIIQKQIEEYKKLIWAFKYHDEIKIKNLEGEWRSSDCLDTAGKNRLLLRRTELKDFK